MSDESTFLRGILARPEDAGNRLVYADWLEERGDPRASFLRMDPELERIRYVPWLEADGNLDYYIKNSAEVRREAEEWRATAPVREQRRALGAKLDPDWVAFINTLGCPFQPFFFFNNHGDPRECSPDELPFTEQIGTRGAVVTFESDFRDEKTWDQGLMRDLGFLTRLDLKEDCAYGAARCPVHPFLCELRSGRRPLTGADILASLRPRAFHSDTIQTLDATDIPYPGYHPARGNRHNDEIHNDFTAQYIFPRGDEDEEEDDEGPEGDVDAFSGTHGALKRFVAGGQLWYVLLHTTPQQEGKYQFSRYAILLAVGQSPHGDRLLGVISHQVCHNLCD